MRSFIITACAVLIVGSAAWAVDPPTPIDREAVLAKLKANKATQ